MSVRQLKTSSDYLKAYEPRFRVKAAIFEKVYRPSYKDGNRHKEDIIFSLQFLCNAYQEYENHNKKYLKKYPNLPSRSLIAKIFKNFPPWPAIKELGSVENHAIEVVSNVKPCAKGKK